MSKNNDFDNEHHRPDPSEYLSKEITQYYGEDLINDIENSSPPIPPKHRRNSDLISVLGICCAVMFLTGAIIFSGVLFSSGINIYGGTSSDSDVVSNNSHTIEHSTDSDIFSDHIISDTDINTDSNIVSSNHSSDNNVHDNTSSNVETDTPDTERQADYFSLPEYPDEGNVSEIDTDENNNTTTNPYDNVTTGKKVRAWVGISLMILSFITALVLNMIKNNKYYR